MVGVSHWVTRRANGRSEAPKINHRQHPDDTVENGRSKLPKQESPSNRATGRGRTGAEPHRVAKLAMMQSLVEYDLRMAS